MRLFRSARWLMFALLLCLIPASSYAGVFISVNFGPPVLPVYEQPPCPEPNLIWTPGYWAYGDDGYYWVPGAWVPAPFPGGLWTPGYWGWSSGLYMFHPGYWGYHVGYYGGVNYGYGYGGIGFAGGEWRGREFVYNTEVMRVDERRVHSTYRDREIVERGYVSRDSHVAFSGGPGGIQHQPTADERVAEHEQHTSPTSFQAQHESTFRADRTSYAKANGGHPTNLVVARPLPVESHPAPPVSHNAIGAQPGGNYPANTGAAAGSHPANIGSQSSGAGAGKSTFTPNHPQPSNPPATHNNVQPYNPPATNHPQPSNPPATHNTQPYTPPPTRNPQPYNPPATHNPQPYNPPATHNNVQPYNPPPTHNQQPYNPPAAHNNVQPYNPPPTHNQQPYNPPAPHNPPATQNNAQPRPNNVQPHPNPPAPSKPNSRPEGRQ